MAELKLQQLISSLEIASDIRNMDEANPITHRLSNSTIRKVTAIVCAVKEPSHLVLPINVTWFVFDPTSPYYRQALRRVSKSPMTNGFEHTWQVVDTIADVFADQYYDAEDTTLLNASDPVPVASTSVQGIAKLSYTPEDASNPVVVGEGDPRLTDARTPKAHSHAEIPATQIKTKTGVVTISQSNPPTVGATLVATSSTTAEWRQLTSSDISR